MATPLCVEDFASDSILLRRPLTVDEKETLCEIITHVLYNFIDSTVSRAYAWTICQTKLASLIADLDAYFQQATSQPCFMRLSSLSPKDAYFILEHNRFFSLMPRASAAAASAAQEEEEEEEPPVTIGELHQELRALRVTSARDCLMLLCHSFRTFIELVRGKHSRACLRAHSFSPPFIP
jgi:hypothetical protein